MLAAITLWTYDVAHVAFANFENNLLLDAFQAVEVFTAGQKEEFVAQQISGTDPAVMLLRIKKSNPPKTRLNDSCDFSKTL